MRHLALSSVGPDGVQAGHLKTGDPRREVPALGPGSGTLGPAFSPGPPARFQKGLNLHSRGEANKACNPNALTGCKENSTYC